MATKNRRKGTSSKKAQMKRPAKKAVSAPKAAPITPSRVGIHPPPCLPGEVEFDDPVTLQKMCRRISNPQ
jgi:hypothetical protein